MVRIKAFFVTAVVMVLAGGFLMVLRENNVWSYYAAMQALGVYGFVMAGLNLARWLRKEEPAQENAQDYRYWAQHARK